MKTEPQATQKPTALEITAVAFSCAGAFTFIILSIIGVILGHIAQKKKNPEIASSGILIVALVIGYFGILRGIIKLLDRVFI
jgi:hypothetical protein